MEKVIKTNCFGIVVTVSGEGNGSIVSDLREDEDNEIYLAAIDGLESLILAHACAGIDIASPAYLEGVETAIEAIANNIYGG